MGFKKILVVGEPGPNGLRPDSLEAVTAARELAASSGAELAGAVIGTLPRPPRRRLLRPVSVSSTWRTILG